MKRLVKLEDEKKKRKSIDTRSEKGKTTDVQKG